MYRYTILWLLVLSVLLSPAIVFAEGTEPDSSEEASGASKVFSGYWAESLWAVVAFCVLLFALWRLAWKPLLGALVAREEHIQKQIDDAEKIREEAKEVLADYNLKLADAEKQGKVIIDQHVKQAEKKAKELAVKANEDIEAMRIRLETDLERARRIAQKELLAQSGEIILQLGREILGRNISAEDNQKLIDEAVDRLNMQEDKSGEDQ